MSSRRAIVVEPLAADTSASGEVFGFEQQCDAMCSTALAHLIRYANFFGTKSSGDPGGINSSFFTLFSKSRTMRWACCMTHQRT